MDAAAGRARLSTTDRHGAHSARHYAQQLFDAIGARPSRPLVLPDEHPALTWARSGLMALTGSASGPGQMIPVPLAACADGVLAALASLAPIGAIGQLRGSQLLAERAAITGHSRAGRVSPGGSCRLLDTADGMVALNLAREDDWALLPAWLEDDVSPAWESVERVLRTRHAPDLVARGRELGLAVAASEDRAQSGNPGQTSLFTSFRRKPESILGNKMDPGLRRGDGKERPLVVDLSSLWAGPLCGRLLQVCGAEVVKIESVQRPDGARRGPMEFFERMNAGKRSVQLDFTTESGRAALRDWLARADIVIEGSRPRALRQLGIHAEELTTANPALTWISLTGYGRGVPKENWVAYGDDAAVAAGLSALQYQATGEWMFVGDAIADPLTGLHAALFAWAGWLAGGSGMVSLALRDVVRHCIEFDLPATPEAVRERQQSWTALLSS